MTKDVPFSLAKEDFSKELQKHTHVFSCLRLIFIESKWIIIKGTNLWHWNDIVTFKYKNRLVRVHFFLQNEILSFYILAHTDLRGASSHPAH